jgi:hypothetical protein
LGRKRSPVKVSCWLVEITYSLGKIRLPLMATQN